MSSVDVWFERRRRWSPSIQYASVCISTSLDTVLWKAKISSSAVNRVRCSAASWTEERSRGRGIGRKKNIFLCSWVKKHGMVNCVLSQYGLTSLRPRSSSSCRSLWSSPPEWRKSLCRGAAASSTTLTWGRSVRFNDWQPECCDQQELNKNSRGVAHLLFVHFKQTTFLS